MKHIELKGQLREASGKQAIKAIRREGLVPCNLYGLGMENILFTVSAKALKPITNTPNSYIIDLELSNGQKINAVLHELQWHPVTDECLHVDFLAVCDTKPVVIDVPVVVTGHAEGVNIERNFFYDTKGNQLFINQNGEIIGVKLKEAMKDSAGNIIKDSKGNEITLLKVRGNKTLLDSWLYNNPEAKEFAKKEFVN